VTAEAVGDGKSVFFTPRKRDLFAGFYGINIDRHKHTQLLRNVIVAGESLFQNIYSII